ncbi:MAG: UPF0175 family protein [Candidatus Micrarchaeia archaeon]
MKNVCVRMDSNQLKRIKRLEDESGQDRSTIFRTVVDKGLKQLFLEKAVKKYADGEVSAWKAAELAGVPLRRMLDELSKRSISLKLSDSTVVEELS